jgi:hypothetical protein
MEDLHVRLRIMAIVLASFAVGAVACSSGPQQASGDEQQQPSNGQDQGDEGAYGSGQEDEGKQQQGQGGEQSRKPSGNVVQVSVSGGKVEASPDPAEVALGKKVTIVVKSDTADEVHVHGYDRVKDVAAGGTARLTFVADIPGAFEVELEESGIELFELRVQ